MRRVTISQGSPSGAGEAEGPCGACREAGDDAGRLHGPDPTELSFLWRMEEREHRHPRISGEFGLSWEKEPAVSRTPCPPRAEGRSGAGKTEPHLAQVAISYHISAQAA